MVENLEPNPAGILDTAVSANRLGGNGVTAFRQLMPERVLVLASDGGEVRQLAEDLIDAGAAVQIVGLVDAAARVLPSFQPQAIVIHTSVLRALPHPLDLSTLRDQGHLL